MNAKKMIMAGTMAATITIGGGLWTEKASAAAYGSIQASRSPAVPSAKAHRQKDDFLRMLGQPSDEEVFAELYSGKTLADLASDSGHDVQAVIDLQVAQLTSQLNARLADGLLSPQTYHAQKSELPEIVAKSVYGT